MAAARCGSDTVTGCRGALGERWGSASGSSRWQDGASVLRVENTGRSLSPTLVPTLTEPFQHGTERIRTGEHAGVGLGLAIVHSIPGTPRTSMPR
jgi:nitrogen fixation/metabolism regulation signal transduction histidine kinase